MSRLESYGSLVPLAIAAGLLSGTYFRQPASTPEVPKPAAKAAETAASQEPLPTSPWLSDLRPVMEVMGDAMGLTLQRSAGGRIAVSAADLDKLQVSEVTKAIVNVRTWVDARVSNVVSACSTGDALSSEARTLNAYLLSDQDSGGSRKLRASAAETAMSDLQDWTAFVTLARTAHAEGQSSERAYHVQFIVATLPDYVDSNAGWFADQSLAAIQSAMTRSRYVLDRFRLIDWTRNDARGDNPVASDSRLHERQPGALIFRRAEGNGIELAVVLLVLETPTSGVHRAALRNAIRFTRAWNRCSGESGPTEDLRVLGPTFSGSSLSLALTLGDPKDDFGSAFPTIRVISGSATADDNTAVFARLAPRNTTFSAAVPATSETREMMSAYLERMNPAWDHGRDVAILRESNTVYGQTPTKYRREEDDPFQHASQFTFPLHVSQLRNDTPASQGSTVTLLPTPVVPLNLRETTPPADQIPALRPQLTSSVVESTVGTILDTIRHERLTAVGIQATDDRDVLFLAREIKREAPDVQLFLMAAHALYLHQDYVPYLRGTLIASPYPLSLTSQVGFLGVRTQGREPFQSMSAEGLFNAMLLLLDPNSEDLLDYCDPRSTFTGPCRPRVAISVIGEDGFWPLAIADLIKKRAARDRSQVPYAQEAKPAVKLTPSELPPLPTQAIIVIALLTVFVLTHVAMALYIDHKLRQGAPAGGFLEWPVVRVIAPPHTYRSASTAHRFTLLMCFVFVALIAAWMIVMVVPFRSSPEHPLQIAQIATAMIAAGGIVLAPVVRVIARSHQLEGLPGTTPQASRRKSSWLLLVLVVLLGIADGAFVWYLRGLVMQGGETSDLYMTLARVVGGGIVSPAPVILFLFAGLYAGMFASTRRTSLVGSGYTQLEQHSPAFALLNGGSKTAGSGNRARLGDVLDMPAQNLPLTYVLAILLVVGVAALAIRQVTTVEGRAFSWFLGAASATVLMLGLMNLAQGLVIWNTARAHLKWLALSPIEGAFKTIAHQVTWDLSLAPPRLMELMPVARRADAIIEQLPSLVDANPAPGHDELESVGKRADTTSKVALLEAEIGRQQQAAFIQSTTWMDLWRVSDAIVAMLRKTAWGPTVPARVAPAGASPAGLPVVLSVSSLPDSHAVEGAFPAAVKMAALIEASPAVHPVKNEGAGLMKECEEFVALQFAFVLRDVVARTVSALFTAMLCLTLLTAAHLLYSFNPRSSLLTMDLLAVAAVSLTSISILVGMEREPVLSRLRNTTPGKIDLNWAFLQRVAIYGVLPLLAVIASLFPEIGNSLFGWLEPLRKLTSF